MGSQELWQMFLLTGSPEAYIRFNEARRLENANVPDDPGPGAPGNRLQ